MQSSRIAALWSLTEPVRVEPMAGGINNHTCRVATGQGDYILRRYRQTAKLTTVRFELEVVRQVAQMGLPFAVPALVPTCSGELLARVGDELVTLVPVIPGVHPDRTDLAHASIMGRALGQLVAAMAGVDASGKPDSVKTYGDLGEIFPAVTDPVGVLEQLPLSAADRKRMAGHLQALLAAIPEAYATLPRQVIHGDYVSLNVLTDGGAVTGVLDFEFTCYDLRAIDLASGLASWTGTGKVADEWAFIDTFGRAYAETQPVEPAEAEALPFLLRLRRAATYVNLAGRYLDGTGREADMQWGVIAYLQMEDWLAVHGARLVRLARSWGESPASVTKPRMPSPSGPASRF